MATWKRVVYAEEISGISYTILDKTDNYTITLSDLEKSISMTSAVAKTLTLPDSSADYIGRRVRCCNLGTAKLTVIPHSGGFINDESEISSEIKYSFVEIVLKAANTWIIDSVGPMNIKLSDYYGPWLIGAA